MLKQRPVEKTKNNQGGHSIRFNRKLRQQSDMCRADRLWRSAGTRAWAGVLALSAPLVLLGVPGSAQADDGASVVASLERRLSSVDGVSSAVSDLMLTSLSPRAPFASASKAQSDLLAAADVARAESTGKAQRKVESRNDLASQQRNIARFVSDKYRIRYSDVHRFVGLAYEAAREFKLDPHLVLAVISIESNFNPRAQSNRGAQGLMQVHTRVHPEKFKGFGGPKAAFDPAANLHVGSRILKEYLERAGTVEGALKSYVGAALLRHDFGYGRKVLGERARIAAAAAGTASTPMLAQQSKPDAVKLAAADLTRSFDRSRSGKANAQLARYSAVGTPLTMLD